MQYLLTPSIPVRDVEFQFSPDVSQTPLRKQNGWNSPNSPIQLDMGPEIKEHVKIIRIPAFVL